MPREMPFGEPFVPARVDGESWEHFHERYRRAFNEAVEAAIQELLKLTDTELREEPGEGNYEALVESGRRAVKGALEKIDVGALKAKILIDHMFLENLLENCYLKPDVEGTVRGHLEATRRNFGTCFASSLEEAMEHLQKTLDGFEAGG